MKRLPLRREFAILPMLLSAAGLFLGACSGGGTTDSPSVSTKQIVTQLLQAGYFKASNTNADDWFGLSVALSGDTLVVGAPHESSSATGVNGNQADNSMKDSGAVYVFTRTAGVWSQQAYLKASNTDAHDAFGYNVAIAGDTIAVGAPFEESNATGVNGDQADNSAPAGAAYVFTRAGGVWTQQAYLKASNTGASDEFGIFVALADETLAVGAWGADPSGAVYVFTRTDAVWSQQAHLNPPIFGGGFGRWLALAGDTLAVGAPLESGAATGVNGDEANNTAPEAGAVYVFTRTAGVWNKQAYLKASNTDAGDKFGQGLALDGNTLVVGARYEASAGNGVNGDQSDNNAPHAGAVYVFTRTAGVWSQQAYLKASNAGANQNFGGSLALLGDVLAVGACLEDSDGTGINGNQGNSNAPDSGAVYLFKRSGGDWTQKAYLKANNSDAGDEFGMIVALSGESLAVGAFVERSNATGVNGNQEDNSAPNSGAVDLFSLGEL
jgi:trimeric autotransporter adhesin